MTHHQEWTPRRGIIKGIFWGLFITLILSVGLAMPAAFAPRVMTHALIRAFITVGVAWICFGVVQSAAGMVGKHTSFIAATCTLLVMYSNHIVWAMNGVPAGGKTGGLAIGWDVWFDPGALIALGLFVWIPLMFCMAMFRQGVPGMEFFSGLSSMRVWGS